MSGLERARIFYRMFLLQAAWNFERMQNIGFAFSLDPWLMRVYGNRREELKLARLRHLESFSTQPHMAPLVAGMICGLEEQAAGAPRSERPARIQRLMQVKGMTAAALAGLGDALFWATLRPLAAAAALAAASLLWRFNPNLAALAAAAALVLVFNLPGLILRLGGLGWGYEQKDELAFWLKAWPWQRWIRGLRVAGLLLALAVVAMRFHGFVSGAVVAAIFTFKIFSGVSGARLYAGLCVIGAGVSILWGETGISPWSWP